MRRTTPRYGYPRAQRLSKPRAYAAVFDYRCSVGGRLFRVYARPNGTSAARLGIVVSKRDIPQAAARNYCKRLAREEFRVAKAALGGVDIVVRPRTTVKRANSRAARTEIRSLFEQAQHQLSEWLAARSR